MNWDDKSNPFGYSVITYLWVIGLACAGGFVKYLNGSKSFSMWALLRDVVTAGFMGLITFWACQWTNINGPLSAVLIATSGLMGNRLTQELEYIFRIKFGMRYSEEIKENERKERLERAELAQRTERTERDTKD